MVPILPRSITWFIIDKMAVIDLIKQSMAM